MVARCFEWQAAALEKHGGQVLTDSASRHCWSFPPSCHMTKEWSLVHDFGQSRTCNCGAVSLSVIPEDTTWTTLSADAVLATPSSPPHVGKRRNPELCEGSPDVCELVMCRVAALSCAAEIAETLLTTAWALQQHN